MEIYLRCIKRFRYTDDDGHPEFILEVGNIYKADYDNGLFYAYGTGVPWSKGRHLIEISKTEAFCELKGKMELVEELP